MPRGNREDVHHVSAHFGKARIVVSVKPDSTLSALKQTLFSALPQLLAHPPFASSSSSSDSLPAPKSPADICLFTPRTTDEGDRIGYVSLEGGGFPTGASGAAGDDKAVVDVEGGEEGVRLDEAERKDKVGQTLKSLGWDKWVDVFVSFRAADGTFRLPTVTLPSLEEDDDVDAEMDALTR